MYYLYLYLVLNAHLFTWLSEKSGRCMDEASPQAKRSALIFLQFAILDNLLKMCKPKERGPCRQKRSVPKDKSPILAMNLQVG